MLLSTGRVHYLYGLKGSSSIEEAISTNNSFSSIDTYDLASYDRDENLRDTDTIRQYKNLKEIIGDNFTIDKENDLFVNEHGAVAGAVTIYDFNRDKKMKEVANKIEELMEENPEYDYELLPGRFPVGADINAGNWDTFYSTHVLYIKNYKELLEKNTKKLMK